MNLNVNGHSLYVERHGAENGTPVVLLHHGLGTTRAWRAQIPILMEAGYAVIVYDRWGYGQSDLRPSLDTPGFADDLADLQALLDTWNFTRSILIGHSDGGTIALHFAAAHPASVIALVTIAAHIYIDPKMKPGIEAVRDQFEQDIRFRESLRRVHGDKFESVFHNWFDGWHQPVSLLWDMRPQLGAITCPTLAIQGEEDEHATPQHARDIAAAIPGAELWLIPGATHMLPQENAEDLNHQLTTFLNAAVHRPFADVKGDQ